MQTQSFTVDDIRTRFGGDEHEARLAELAETDEEHARLDARYGPGGTWDAQRKAFRSVRAVAIREQLAADGRKATEPMVEELAASHPEVMAYLDHAELERARYAVLSSERESIKERLRFLRGLVYAAGAEARLQ